MSEDGYIITNAHVVGNSKRYNVKVVLNATSEENTDKEYAAVVVGFDIRTDLAVLKIDAHGLPTAEFGNSDQLQVGEWVLAIGNPRGLEYSNSLTRGTVSALNRSVGDSNSLVKFIQTDAAINPGNSGGALTNMYGQVIGISSSKIVAEGYEGMGFAIPINTAKTIIDDLIKTGYVSGRVRLGISVDKISAFKAQMYDVPQGLIIMKISDDSDLNFKNVKVGDIITKINGINTMDSSSLFSELEKHSVGETVTLTIYRMANNSSKETTFDIDVKLLEDKGETQQSELKPLN